MIIITVKSDHKFYYKGNIVLHANDFGVVISANWMENNWNGNVIDLFPYDDIESICGTYEKVKK